MQADIDDHSLNNWIRAASLHDQAAFERLYNATSPYVFGLLKRMLATQTQAEEALQEVYLRVWAQAGSYDSRISAPKTWILGITRHHAIELLRNNATTNSPAPSDAATLKSLPYAQHTSVLQSLDPCFDHLDMATREYLLRAYCEGFSCEELSHAYQQPTVTIRNRIRQGLQKVREYLDERH